MQFKAYEMLISGIFHPIVLDHGLPSITETAESTIGVRGVAQTVEHRNSKCEGKKASKNG